MVTADEIRMMERHRRLLPDLERIEAYGAGQPNAYAGIQYEGHRLVALFTDPDGHRDAVLALAEHPEDIEVRCAPFTRVELVHVHTELVRVLDAHPGSWISHGVGNTAVKTRLHEDFEDLATELRERFGDRIDVQVGGSLPRRA